MNEMIEICEYYEGGRLVRKTANGIDLPLNDPSLPTCMQETLYMTAEEAERIWGKFLKFKLNK